MGTPNLQNGCLTIKCSSLLYSGHPIGGGLTISVFEALSTGEKGPNVYF